MSGEKESKQISIVEVRRVRESLQLYLCSFQLIFIAYFLSPKMRTSIATNIGPPPRPKSSARVNNANAVPRDSGYVTFCRRKIIAGFFRISEQIISKERLIMHWKR
jgi:hypothetical protein